MKHLLYNLVQLVSFISIGITMDNIKIAVAGFIGVLARIYINKLIKHDGNKNLFNHLIDMIMGILLAFAAETVLVEFIERKGLLLLLIGTTAFLNIYILQSLLKIGDIIRDKIPNMILIYIKEKIKTNSPPKEEADLPNEDNPY